MIEIVFGESACGSLKIAQTYGKGKYRGSAVSIFMRHEDGSVPSSDEMKKAQLQAQEQERIAWENAIPLGGKSSDVYCFDMALSVGDISDNGIGEQRKNVFKKMLYAAVVLMVICLTVLSLQQLLDASQYKYRFSVLRKLGVEDTHIGKLVLKQLGIWFGLPIVVAIIVSTMVIIYFIQTISAEISAYIGFGALMTQIGMTVSILALLLICYFISTWLLFKKSIK